MAEGNSFILMRAMTKKRAIFLVLLAGATVLVLFFLCHWNLSPLIAVIDHDEPTVHRWLRNDSDPQYYDDVVQIVHQSWKNSTVPKVFQRYLPSWRRCFPGFSYRLWTDEDNRRLVARHYGWFLDKYDGFPSGIYRADCARYFYLLHFGGIYSDLDNECLAAFEGLLANHSLVFSSIDHVNRRSPLPGNRYVQNSFMYSRPGHPFWRELLLEILAAGTTSRPDISTGPEVLATVLQRYLARGATDVRIYEAALFNPLTWGDTSKNPVFCKPFNGMTDDEYRQCRAFYDRRGAYVVQYHTHIWE